jgi:hypothetical protein
VCQDEIASVTTKAMLVSPHIRKRCFMVIPWSPARRVEVPGTPMLVTDCDGFCTASHDITWTRPESTLLEPDSDTRYSVAELLEDLNVYRSAELQISAQVFSVTFDPKHHASLEDLIAAAEKRLA